MLLYFLFRLSFHLGSVVLFYLEDLLVTVKMYLDNSYLLVLSYIKLEAGTCFPFCYHLILLDLGHY